MMREELAGMPAAVAVQNLQKRYGPVEAVRGVSFDIAAAEIFGLIGPNGAGKTTTVECLLGLREPDAGDIHIGGRDARRDRDAVKARTGAALQTTALQDKITPREALDLFGAFYDHRLATNTLLDRFALGAKASAPFDSLSGGQRQRLALALAFVNDPELVVLDEPTAGLDPLSRRDLHSAIAGMKADGRTVLLTTHDLEEASHLCDRIGVIHRGQVVAIGTPAELSSSIADVPSVSLVTSAPVDAAVFARIPGLTDLVVQGPHARFRTADVNRALAELVRAVDAEHATIVDLRVQRASLEDVFVQLTREAHAEAAP
jgi:ABC-2 type transport system ATP-binding protein